MAKFLEETFIELVILKFRGTKRINSLDAFLFEYRPSKDGIKANLVGFGQKVCILDERLASPVPRGCLLHA